MNTESKCYICGRTEDTVKEYIFKSVITQKQNTLELSNNSKKNVEEEYNNKIEKIQRIMAEVQRLPEFIKKMKVTTLRVEQNNLKHDFPIIEEVLTITKHSDNGMLDELKETFEKQVNDFKPKIEEAEKKLFLNQDRFNFEKEFFSTHLNVKHSKWVIPIKNNGRFRDNVRVQSPSSKIVSEIMKEYRLNFDQAYSLAKTGSEIMREIRSNLSRYRSDDQVLKDIKVKLQENQNLIDSIDDNLVSIIKKTKGSIESCTEIKKNLYVPQKIEVPVCYICRSMFDEIKYMER